MTEKQGCFISEISSKFNSVTAQTYQQYLLSLGQLFTAGFQNISLIAGCIDGVECNQTFKRMYCQMIEKALLDSTKHLQKCSDEIVTTFKEMIKHIRINPHLKAEMHQMLISGDSGILAYHAVEDPIEKLHNYFQDYLLTVSGKVGGNVSNVLKKSVLQPKKENARSKIVIKENIPCNRFLSVRNPSPEVKSPPSCKDNVEWYSSVDHDWFLGFNPQSSKKNFDTASNLSYKNQKNKENEEEENFEVYRAQDLKTFFKDSLNFSKISENRNSPQIKSRSSNVTDKLTKIDVKYSKGNFENSEHREVFCQNLNRVKSFLGSFVVNNNSKSESILNCLTAELRNQKEDKPIGRSFKDISSINLSRSITPTNTSGISRQTKTQQKKKVRGKWGACDPNLMKRRNSSARSRSRRSNRSSNQSFSRMSRDSNRSHISDKGSLKETSFRVKRKL